MKKVLLWRILFAISFLFIVVTSGSFDLCINKYFKSLRLKRTHHLHILVFKMVILNWIENTFFLILWNCRGKRNISFFENNLSFLYCWSTWWTSQAECSHKDDRKLCSNPLLIILSMARKRRVQDCWSFCHLPSSSSVLQQIPWFFSLPLL